MRVLKTSIRFISYCMVILLICTGSAIQAQQSDTNSNRSPAGPASVDSSADTIVTAPDVRAMPKGGMNAFYGFVAENFTYPKRCQSKGINGYVLLMFVVEVDGSISDVKPIETTATCPEFAEEAIRVLLAAPKWTPAQKNGKPVKSYRKMPIKLEVQN